MRWRTVCYFACVCVLLVVGAGATVVAVRLPRTAPAADGAVANSIHAFNHPDPEKAHPEFRVLTGERIDKTLLAFGHDVHMDADTPIMQDRLTDWVAALRADGVPGQMIPVTKLADGRLRLTCTACHVADVAGRYMQPIRFERHCVQCHPLGESDWGDPVPHGAAIGPFLEAAAARTLHEREAEKAAAPQNDGQAQPGPSPRPGPQPGPRPGPRGDRGDIESTPPDPALRLASASPAVAVTPSAMSATALAQPRPGPSPGPRRPGPSPAGPGAAQPAPDDAGEAARREWAYEVQRLTHLLANQKCSKCHIQLIDVARPRRPRPNAPSPQRQPIDLDEVNLTEVDWSDVETSGGIDWSRVDPTVIDWTKVDWRTVHASNWSLVDPHIPDRWMPRSVFGHKAHQFLACTECHADAVVRRQTSTYPDTPMADRLKATGRTKDIMLPAIASCRSCHHRNAGARHDCVLCHLYHDPTLATNEGGAYAPGAPANKPFTIERFTPAADDGRD